MANILRKPWKEAVKKPGKSLLSLERRQELAEAKKLAMDAKKVALLEVRRKKKAYFEGVRQKELEKKEKKMAMKLLK